MRFTGLLLILNLLFLNTLLAQNTPVQSNLNRIVTARFANQPVHQVLSKISEQGNFYFSYSGHIMKKDSIVSLNVQGKTIRDVLDQLFQGSVDYKESGNYIILKSALFRFNIEANDIENTKNSYEVTGYIFDQHTGERIKNATIFEKRLLKSTLSDEQGYFKLKFKGEQGVILTISKEDYRDTSISYLSSVVIRPEGYTDDPGYSNRVERYRFARFLMSSRQRIQSMNIPSFIANSPFQASFLPGLSSHGMLSSQIVNKGSLNVIGGYTAGVDGAEIAGVFNINKKDVKNFQAAGVLNIVGGSVEGFQAAGVFNVVLDSVVGSQAAGVFNNVEGSVSAFQAAGMANRVRRNFVGAQAAGFLNVTQGSLKGVQAAGFLNIAGGAQSGSSVAGFTNFGFGNIRGTQVSGFMNLGLKNLSGTQVSGFLNVTGGELKGVQVSGFVNFARKMHGTQIGLINVADTSSGYSIGLLNIIRKGYHKISISGNEVMNTNLGIKTGNDKFYTVLIGGANLGTSKKIYSAGLGIGHDFIFNSQLSMAVEGSSQFIYLGDKNDINNLYKIQPLLQYQFIKGLTLFAGPNYSIFNSRTPSSAAGYKSSIGPAGAKTIFNGNAKAWLGYSFGVTFM